MPFFLLLLLLIVCLPGSWRLSLIPVEPSVLLSLLLTALCVAVGSCSAARIVRRRQRAAPALPPDPTALARQYNRNRTRQGLAIIGLYGLALFVFGWGWAVQTWLTPAQAGNAELASAMYPGGELLI